MLEIIITLIHNINKAVFKHPLRILFLITLTYAINSIWGQILTQPEQQNLVEMLQAANLEETDLNFLKDWDPSTKFKLNCQVQSLNNPWQFFGLLDELKLMSKRFLSESSDSVKASVNTSDIVYKVSPYLDLDITDGISGNMETFTDPEFKTPRATKDFFTYISEYMQRIDDFRNSAISRITPEQLDSLSYWMFQAWQESEDSLSYNQFFSHKFPNISTGITTQRAIELFSLFSLNDFGKTWYGWERFTNVISYYALRNRFTNKKPLYFSSIWGTMIIGTMGDDNYTNDKRLRKNPVCFILDPGGNDTYDCDLFTGNKHPYYLVIDLKGNDLYRNPGIGKGMSVLAGCGTILDYEGNDIYQLGDFAMSALLGYQCLKDYAGNDIYSSGLFSQAAAMFGISVLQDNAGNDTYTATEFAQGMGGPKGVGLLLDGKGNDVYYCGGKYLHTPLAPFDYRSMAQGFGFGFRPDLAGGIGILYDASGNDRYSGGIYAQGVAYWYAIGVLFDESGNDYYDAVYYPQGSGIHLANGALIDMEGEDHYYSKHGPGQGNGHDWSVGVFIDQKGNDEYSIEGGDGLGLTNSVGIFIDGEGDDKYEQRNASNYGYANSARETGGIGLFLDMGGKDAYPDSTEADNKTWQQGTYGIGRDIDVNAAPLSKLEKLAELEVADVDSLAAIDTLFGIASEWEVGSAIKRVQLARRYLLKREDEAVPYAISTKMNTQSGLEFRTLEELAKNSAQMRASLYDILHAPDSLAVKNSIALLAEQADSTSQDSLAIFLENKRFIPTVLSALGSYKSSQALALLIPWLEHPWEKYRYLAARSLKAMHTSQSLAELNKMAGDYSYLIKAMIRQLPAENRLAH